MRPSKIRVAKYEHSATSKWVVEGLKNNKGRRSRKFFHTKAEADLFARDAHAYRSIPHLDPAIRARLESALQRPDSKAHYPGQNRGSPQSIMKHLLLTTIAAALIILEPI